MDRFWKKPLRIIQNNLRATDAEKMDVEQLIRTQAEYGTNVIVANAGGIMCWYESSISRQPHNPYLKTDYVSQVMHYAHQYGMKVLLRLDVSNLSEKDVHEHPDWLRRDAEGKAVTDLGMPQSCFFSPMWQEYNFQLIDELMTRYKPDGLFYNANHFGFCPCEVCKSVIEKPPAMSCRTVCWSIRRKDASICATVIGKWQRTLPGFGKPFTGIIQMRCWLLLEASAQNGLCLTACLAGMDDCLQRPRIFR